MLIIISIQHFCVHLPLNSVINFFKGLTGTSTLAKYSNQDGFQYQIDNFNCGTYVRIIAKCKKLAMHKATRQTISLEQYNN